MAQTPRSVARQPGYSFSEGDIRARLESFRDARLMTEMDGRYLSLAVWRNRAERGQMASAHPMQVPPGPQPVPNLGN